MVYIAKKKRLIRFHFQQPSASSRRSSDVTEKYNTACTTDERDHQLEATFLIDGFGARHHNCELPRGKTQKFSAENCEKSTDHMKRKFYFSLLLDSQSCMYYKLTIDTYAEYFIIANVVCEAIISPISEFTFRTEYANIHNTQIQGACNRVCTV